MKNLKEREEVNKFVYWPPRIASIIFIAFLAIFALDVFEGESSIFEKMIGLFIHLLPNFILLVILIIAWKNEKIGGILFVLLSVVFTYFFKTYTNPHSFIFVSLPVFVIGILFFIQWNFRKIQKSKIK